jgi:hypothetical protein
MVPSLSLDMGAFWGFTMGDVKSGRAFVIPIFLVVGRKGDVTHEQFPPVPDRFPEPVNLTGSRFPPIGNRNRELVEGTTQRRLSGRATDVRQWIPSPSP